MGNQVKGLRMKTMLLLLSMFALPAALAAQTNIPVGTVIPVTLNSTLDARRSKPGQRITAKVAQDVPLYNGTTIKAGTRLEGEVLAVTSAVNSQPATIALRFDRLNVAGQATSISTNLRALASPLEVETAQTAVSGDERGSAPPWSQTTNQIGGDVAYREAGKVYYGLEPVGTSVYAGSWGVLSRVAANPNTGCRGAIADNDNPQALWVFSHDACGVYGYHAVIMHAGRTNPEGRILVASTQGNLKLRSGSGVLLRVNVAGGSGQQSASE
jgi:hypothetical protein